MLLLAESDKVAAIHELFVAALLQCSCLSITARSFCFAHAVELVDALRHRPQLRVRFLLTSNALISPMLSQAELDNADFFRNRDALRQLSTSPQVEIRHTTNALCVGIMVFGAPQPVAWLTLGGTCCEIPPLIDCQTGVNAKTLVHYFEQTWDTATPFSQVPEIRQKLAEQMEAATPTCSGVPYEVFIATIRHALHVVEHPLNIQRLNRVLERANKPSGEYLLSTLQQAMAVIHAERGVIIGMVAGWSASKLAAIVGHLRVRRGLILCSPEAVGDTAATYGWRNIKRVFGLTSWNIYTYKQLVQVAEIVHTDTDFDLVIIDNPAKVVLKHTAAFQMLQGICYGRQVVIVADTPPSSQDERHALLQLIPSHPRMINTVWVGRSDEDLAALPEFEPEAKMLAEVRHIPMICEVTPAQADFIQETLEESFSEHGSFKGALYAPGRYIAEGPPRVLQMELHTQMRESFKQCLNSSPAALQHRIKVAEHLLRRFEAFLQKESSFYWPEATINQCLSMMDSNAIPDAVDLALEQALEHPVETTLRYDLKAPSFNCELFLKDIASDIKFFKKTREHLGKLGMLTHDPKILTITKTVTQLMTHTHPNVPDSRTSYRKVVVITTVHETLEALALALEAALPGRILVQREPRPEVPREFDTVDSKRSDKFSVLLTMERACTGQMLSRAGALVQCESDVSIAMQQRRIAKLRTIGRNWFDALYVFTPIRKGEPIHVEQAWELPPAQTLSFRMMLNQAEPQLIQQPELRTRIQKLPQRLKVAYAGEGTPVLYQFRAHGASVHALKATGSVVERVSLEEAWRAVFCTPEAQSVPLDETFWTGYAALQRIAPEETILSTFQCHTIE